MITLMELWACGTGCKGRVVWLVPFGTPWVWCDVDDLQTLSSRLVLSFFTGALLVKRAAVLNYLRIPLREAHALERLKVIVTLSPWQILVRISLFLFLAHCLFGWSTVCLCHVILSQEQ